MGAVLTGLANGLSNVPQQLNDLAFQQASRQQQLQQGSIANQQAQLQLQQAQTAQQNQQDYQQAMVQAWQGAQGSSDQTASPPVAAGQPAATNAPQVPGNAYGNLAPLQKAGITLAQLDTLAQQNGVPPEIAYGVIASESQGNPNAVSPKGAVGSFQVMPATAAQPGFGVAPFDPKSPQGAMSYMGAMWKKAGGDPAKFSAMWNAGPGGNPQNPETQGFTKNVAKNAQAFQLSQAATQAAQQPSPADQIAAREDAGVDTPPPVYKQAIQGQQQQIQMLQKVYQQAMQQGHPAVAQMVMGQINDLQGKQLELQTKGLAVQKDANTQTATLAAGVKDQSSYNNLRAQIQSNPAMQQAVAGLNLTGNYDQDRNKLQTLADRSVTLKDQQEIKLKQAELQLKQQKEQREQAQADQIKVASVQAQQADQKRQVANSDKGLPTTPSLAVTMVGATPAQVQAQQAKINTARNTYVASQLQPAIQGTQKVDAYTKEILGELSDKGPGGAVTTGGISNWPVVRNVLNATETGRQKFEKDANNLVLAQQQSLMSLGAARSSGTAAMAKIIGSAKPNLDVNNTTNKEIATQIYVANQMVKTQQQFMSEFLHGNPSALPQDGLLEWQRFENALGDMVYEDDKAETRHRFNDKIVKNNPDGTPNKGYVDFHEWFKANPD